MNSSNKFIVFDEVIECPKCHSNVLYFVNEEYHTLTGFDGKELTTTLTDLVCLKCKLQILEVTSDDKLIEKKEGAPSRFGT